MACEFCDEEVQKHERPLPIAIEHYDNGIWKARCLINPDITLQSQAYGDTPGNALAALGKTLDRVIYGDERDPIEAFDEDWATACEQAALNRKIRQKPTGC